MPEFNQKFNRETLTAAEREAHPAFKRLAGEMQQVSFVGYWIDSGGDQFFAHQAYSSPNAETSRKSSYDVMQRKAVKDAIDAFLCKSEKEKFLEELARASRSRNITPTKLRLFELRAATEFGVDLKTLKAEAQSKKSAKESEAAPAETKRYKVGDIVDYGNQKIRITKLENGQPVEGDPVVASPEAW